MTGIRAKDVQTESGHRAVCHLGDGWTGPWHPGRDSYQAANADRQAHLADHREGCVLDEPGPSAEPMAATCRHCGRALSRINAGWVDEDGMAACVKAPAESAGHGRRAAFVLHEPMPAGLGGAPGA